MKKLDIIIFGATGYTGQVVTRNIADICSKPEYCVVKWGISGRSVEKLKVVAKEVEDKSVPIILCDVENATSVRNMTEQAKVVINCTGPYTILGEEIVRICIETSTHYVDVTAELYFMLRMYGKYHEAAVKANVLIITACGYGSLPGVMGFAYLQKQFEGKLNTVQCYTELKIPKWALIPGPGRCIAHYGTWSSFVGEFANYREYKRIKNQMFPKPLISEPEPAELKKSLFHKHAGRFWFPYPGPDADIVEMTQRYNEKKGIKPVFFKIYTTTPFLYLLVIPAAILIYLYLCSIDFFRKLLLKYPRVFTAGYMSHKGPSDRMSREMKYDLTLHGEGTADLGSLIKKSMTVKITGSDPAYKTTAVSIILSAITILKDYRKMPSGGVVTSGSAFYDTNLIERLNNDGMEFEVLQN